MRILRLKCLLTFLIRQLLLFLNSYENPTQSSVAPVSLKVLPTAALVQAVNDKMKLHLSVRDGVKVMNLTHTMEFSKPKVVTARLVLVPKSSQCNYQKNQICCLRAKKKAAGLALP
ncbi:unnamed protein product [Hymenolepis diminuta]|uniref:Uncharacterized protein n=1 Tax=Hymenolepis diminuta TaxID=6216 RepID=A0A564Y705_HYMDI|nr:unnamed protein product [Hymenolepis diminuta]